MSSDIFSHFTFATCRLNNIYEVHCITVAHMSLPKKCFELLYL
jgi:hypothetical protein